MEEANRVCGTHTFDHANRAIYFVLTADSECVLQVNVVNSVRVSMRL